MKVGILSMHRVINYGSFLQAYALRQLLLRNGADEVSFIDIKPGHPLKGFEPESRRSRICRHAGDVLHGRLFDKIHGREYFSQVSRCIGQHLSLLNIDEAGNEYDLAVIGSDEVFNCCQRSTWGYTLQLYGDIPEAKKTISYAASFGYTRYEQLLEHGIAEEIGTTLKTLSAISVRDQNSFDIVKKLTGREATRHLDPVLIYGYQSEMAQMSLPEERDYMVVYAYPGRIQNKTEIKTIRNFAKQQGKRLVSLYSYYGWCDKSIVPSSPFEVLAWFKGADGVVTDTFHGTIFSIITRKPFCTLVRNTNGEKLGSLLSDAGLEDRMIARGNLSLMPSILERRIDYDAIEEWLRKERAKAGRYLGDAMKTI